MLSLTVKPCMSGLQGVVRGGMLKEAGRPTGQAPMADYTGAG